jgi:hypothetical protein
MCIGVSSVSTLADVSAVADKQLIVTPTAKIFHPEKDFVFFSNVHT